MTVETLITLVIVGLLLALVFVLLAMAIRTVPEYQRLFRCAAHVGAAHVIAITTLRAVVGSMMLDDVLAKREHINEALRR